MNEPLSAGTSSEPDFLPLRLLDLFLHPNRLMAHVGLRPAWWPAGLLLLLINGVATTWEGPIIVEEFSHSPGHSRIENLVSREQVQAHLAEAVDSGNQNRLVSIVTTGINSWAVTIVFALVLGFFVKMAGGVGSFGQALGIVHWAALIPYGLGTLIKLPLILSTGQYARITLGPAIWMPAGSTGSFLFTLLSAFSDLTIWWGLWVVVIGFSRVFRLERASTAVSVLFPWALSTLVVVGFSYVFGF